MNLSREESGYSCHCTTSDASNLLPEDSHHKKSAFKHKDSPAPKKSFKLNTPKSSTSSLRGNPSSSSTFKHNRSVSICSADVSNVSSALKIKCGAPVVMITWKTIWKIVLVCYVGNVLIILYAIMMLALGISTQQTIGDFLNMVSEGDGTAIPVCLILAGFFCIPLSAGFIFVTYKSCSKARNRVMNSVHFALIVVAICLVVLLFSLAFFCVGHAYSSLQHRLHSGIMDAMQKYKTTPATKTRVDILQITFHCCGSKTYSEWFDVAWFDTSDATVEADQITRDDAPFSCCSIHSRYPCIHHDLMSVGSRYLYAPETNLSVSEHGCQPVLVRHVRSVAWHACLALLGLAVLLAAVAVAQRFLQTAHQEMYRYERNSHWHTAWVIGCYKGRRGKMAPKPPPIPDELMR